jgi:hypothetical protein
MSNITRRDFLKLGAVGAALPLSPSVPDLQVSTAPAFFASFLANSGSLQNGVLTNLTGAYFPHVREGVVSWYDAYYGYFQSNAYWLKISGSVSMKNAPGRFKLSVHIYNKADNAYLHSYPLADTADQVATVSAVLNGITPDMYFRLLAYQEYPVSANAIRPNLLFEAIP